MKSIFTLIVLISLLGSNNANSQTISLDNQLACDVKVTVHNGGTSDPACFNLPLCDCCKDVICVPAYSGPTNYALSCSIPQWCSVNVVDPCPSGSNCTDATLILTSWSGCNGYPTTATLFGTSCPSQCSQTNITVTWTNSTTVVIN